MPHRIKDPACLAKIASGRLQGLNTPWAELLHMAVCYSFDKNTTIALHGAMSGDFYYLEKGLVCVKNYSESGKERSALFFGEGSLFNVAACFLTLPEPNVWDCLADTKAWRFSGRLLSDTAFIAQYPHLIRNLMQGMSINLMSQFERHTEACLAPPIRRVAKYIKGICDEAGSFDFAAHLSQHNVATQLAMHRATLALAIQQLKEQGIIACFTQKRVHVLDYALLCLVAEGKKTL